MITDSMQLARVMQHATVGGMQGMDSVVGIAFLTMQVEHVYGEIVEFGCCEGKTSCVISAFTNKPLHVYDSFQGLPEKHEKDGVSEKFVKGEIRSCPERVIQNFNTMGLVPPKIHAGWFFDLKDSDVPDAISLAFLDADFYESITQSLNIVYPRMSPGGLIIIHDYLHTELPGVKLACDEFEQNIPEKFTPVGLGLNSVAMLYGLWKE